ncbi:hypothetical protein GCM10023187_09820 [Nibrella viscosa]|uniref:Uncharacterized protein n=1 Tax=Nibrella viscosa TaxID=1084524 RepID=A0ABP8K0K5_9BACT
MMSFLLNSLSVEHAFGIPEVAKLLSNAPSGEVIIGVVDNDKEKRVPIYLTQFTIQSSTNRVLVKQKPGSNQYLIVIDKALESFLLWNAEQVNLDVTSFGFPDSPKLLGRRLKYALIDHDRAYIDLLAALRNRQAPGLITLERILNDFITT